MCGTAAAQRGDWAAAEFAYEQCGNDFGAWEALALLYYVSRQYESMQHFARTPLQLVFRVPILLSVNPGEGSRPCCCRSASGGNRSIRVALAGCRSTNARRLYLQTTALPRARR